MPIVGEAVIVVRVVSDRLAADIRDAVKRGMARAAPDIDQEGEAAGKRMAAGVNRGVKDSSKDIGKELDVYSRRFVASAEGIFDDGGRRIGRKFSDSIARGIRDNEDKTRASVDRSVSRTLALRSGSTIDQVGRALGTRFTKAVGDGIDEGGIGKELAIRDTGLERQGQDFGRRFGRAIGSGVQDEQERIWADARKSFRMRPGDIDDDGTFLGERLADGTERGWRSRFGRFRQAADDAAQNMASNLGRGFRRMQSQAGQAGENFGSSFTRGFMRDGGKFGDAINDTFRRIRNNGILTGNSVNNSFTRMRTNVTRTGDSIGNGFTRGFARARAAGDSFFSKFNAGFTTLNRNSNTAGDGIGNNIRNNVNRSRPGLLKMFSGLGGDLAKHFNLGIGAAKMGEAIISILATAGPSLISGAAAIGTALAAEIVVAMAAIGPGLAGAVGVGIAAVSTLALNFGLLKLAIDKTFKTVEGAKIKESLKEIGNLLGTPVSQGLLEGMTESVNHLKDTVPQLTEVLKLNGKAWGGVITKILDTVSSGENIGRIKGILSTNATFVTNFGDGLKGLTDSFLILFNASKPFIDFIGEGIKRFGEWADASLSVSEANGNLATWMDGMLASFQDLWGIVKNFGKGIGNIFSAAAPAGESLLGSIRGIAERFQAWTSDSGNQERMTAFFDKAHTLASKVFDVLGSIFTAGGKAFEGMDLGPILHVLDTLEKVVGPAIARIFNQIQAGASENLVKTFDNIGSAITKIADSGSFQKVADFMSAIFLKVSELANSDFGSTVLAWVIPIGLLGGAVTALLGPLATLGGGIFKLAVFAAGGETALAGLAAAAAPFVAIGAAVAGAFALMWANSEDFRTAIGDLVSAVGGTLMEIWNKLAPKLQEIWQKFQQLAGVIGDRLAPIIEFLIPIVQRVFNFIGDTFGNFLTIVGGVIDFLIGVFTGDWGRIWEGIKEVFKGAWDQVVNVFNTAKDALSFIWDAITATVYNAGQVIWGFITSVWTGISSWLSTTWDTIKQQAIDHWNGIWQFFEDIWNQITTAFHVAVDAVASFLSTSWDTIKQQVIDHWNGIWAFFEGIWNQITTAFHVAVDNVRQYLSDRWDDIKNTAAGIWQGIKDTATTIWNNIKSAIIDPIVEAAGTVAGWWDTITEGIHTAWDGLVGVVSGIWDDVSNAIWQPIMDAYNQVTAWIEAIGGVIEGVITTVTNAFNTVTDLVGSILGAQQTAIGAALNTPSAPLSALGPQLKGILDVAVPALARGGIIPAVPGGMLVRAGEAGRPERVDPIQRNGLTARDEALIRMMSAQLAGVATGGNDVNVNVSLGERSLEAFVTSIIKREDSNKARRVGRVRAT